MDILRKMASFSAPMKDMLTAYIAYIRSMLEQSCVIWHSTLTEENKEDLERVQKKRLQEYLTGKIC